MSDNKIFDQKKYINVPNMITTLRIIGSIVLLFLKIETIPFYVVYGVCGVSDAVDGFVARKTGQTTNFGKKLDSMSDLIFYLIMAYKMFTPLVETLHPVIFRTVISLVAIRLCIYLIAALKFKVFLTTHAILNKATGLVVFLIPYTIPFKDFFFYYSILGCVIAGLAIFSEIWSYKHKRQKKDAPKKNGNE